MTIYVAGPMRGYPDFNFGNFDRIATLLRNVGHTVKSPADHDRESGFDGKTPPGPDGHPLPGDFDLKSAIMWDLDAVANADAVFLLEGWQMSSGARLEHDLARFLGKKVFFEDFHNQ